MNFAAERLFSREFVSRGKSCKFTVYFCCLYRCISKGIFPSDRRMVPLKQKNTFLLME